jgi:hypothetical protein
MVREPEKGEPQRIAQGYEDAVPMSLEVDGTAHEWIERRLVVRSRLPAQAAESGLRVRVAKAKSQVAALNRRGRGRKHGFEDEVPIHDGEVDVLQPDSRTWLSI